MSEREYLGLDRLVEGLKKMCSDITIGGKELAQGMEDFKGKLKRFFFFIRLLVEQDFKSSTGMSFEKWIEFGNRLSETFEDITSVIQKIYDCYSESDFEKIPETLDELDRAITPFINDYDSMIDSLTNLQKYSSETSTGIKSVPSAILSDEEKQTIAKDLSKSAADLKTLIDTLEQAKTKLLDVKRFK